MQALRARQDENSGVLPPGKQRNAENEDGGRSRGLKGGLVPNSARKVMGNLTNTAARRALGDITNATPVGKGGSVLRKSLQQPQQATPRSVAARKPLQERPAQDLWAEEGTEQPAGKSWRQLERGREAAVAAQIRANVAAVLAPPLASSWAAASPQRSRLGQPQRPPTPEQSPTPAVRPAQWSSSDLSDLVAAPVSPLHALEVIEEA